MFRKDDEGGKGFGKVEQSFSIILAILWIFLTLHLHHIARRHIYHIREVALLHQLLQLVHEDVNVQRPCTLACRVQDDRIPKAFTEIFEAVVEANLDEPHFSIVTNLSVVHLASLNFRWNPDIARHSQDAEGKR